MTLNVDISCRARVGRGTISERIERIAEYFGPDLLATPNGRLRSMLNEEFGDHSDDNVFVKMWEMYRVVPTADMLAEHSRSRGASMRVLVDKMQTVFSMKDNNVISQCTQDTTEAD